jgi:hypothetical protein
MMWLIITKQRVYIPGDERSRSNPGHGYPASYESYDSVEKFETNQFEKYKNRLRDLILNKTPYETYKAESVTVSHTIELNIVIT